MENYLLVLVHEYNTQGVRWHIVRMPFIILPTDFNHTMVELVLISLLFHFLDSFGPILLHDFIVLKIKVILDRFLNLFCVQIFPIIILLTCLLLILENVFGGRNIFSWLPIALLYMDVLPFCCYAACHISFN